MKRRRKVMSQCAVRREKRVDHKVIVIGRRLKGKIPNKYALNTRNTRETAVVGGAIICKGGEFRRANSTVGDRFLVQERILV